MEPFIRPPDEKPLQDTVAVCSLVGTPRGERMYRLCSFIHPRGGAVKIIHFALQPLLLQALPRDSPAQAFFFFFSFFDLPPFLLSPYYSSSPASFPLKFHHHHHHRPRKASRQIAFNANLCAVVSNLCRSRLSSVSSFVGGEEEVRSESWTDWCAQGRVSCWHR